MQCVLMQRIMWWRLATYHSHQGNLNNSLSSVLQHSETVNGAQTAIFIGHLHLIIKAAYYCLYYRGA